MTNQSTQPNPAAPAAPITPRNTPLVLIIRDGWGENPFPAHDAFNAVKLANTPTDDMLRRDWPWTLVKTSGEDVGLPDSTMGNSEVGHQNIGAGRIVDQESVAITKACRAGLDSNAALADAILAAKRRGRYVHIMGIASDAGVHGLLSHLYAVIELCRKLDQVDVALHLFTDGRDTGPYSGLEFIREIESKVRRIGIAGEGSIIASVIGRYWAMDRDFRWERVERAYRCLTGQAAGSGGSGGGGGGGIGGALPAGVLIAENAELAIKRYYDRPTGESTGGDEFVPPTMIARHPEEAARTRIKDGDTVIFYNYRGDRPREIVSAFVLPDPEWAQAKPSPDSGTHGFKRGPKLDLEFVTMTAYSEALAPYVNVAFPKPPKMVSIAGEYLSNLGLRQFRCAETEKYPHVTFFFNDYRDQPFPGESRENPQSPKVATYDQKPEMSADLVRDAVLRRLAATDCEDVLIVNFANGDMVGHTGKLAAAVKACETVDTCVGQLIDATLRRGGSLLICADHGNAEQMFDPDTGSPHTAHTTYDVPVFIVGAPFKGRRLRGDNLAANWQNPAARQQRGRLADLMPTALDMMGLPMPSEMTGRSLLA